jgi:myo-inositol-1(or 4)-monophosphatase
MLMSSPPDLALRLLPIVEEAAREAGALALRSFRLGGKTTARHWNKAGNSPVTEADLAVDALLKERLSAALPEAAWLSEETADDPARLGRRLVWIVDPIDGTRAFLTGHADWSVSIGLVAEGRPVLGVVHAPSLRVLYSARSGGGARRNGTTIRGPAATGLEGARTAGPKPLMDVLARRSGFLDALPKVPSLALRLARVADGSIDIGLVSANAHDWDLAAADLLLEEAGARLSDLRGRPPRYNQPEPVHAELIATSDRLHPDLVAAMGA